ncbi:MAG TPA: hypothetical protein VGQ83_13335 [Polyangia bacterium]|jgi:uncharacterized membrane protein YccC
MTPSFFKTDKQGKRSLEEVLREAWLGALGALSTAEGELLRLGERLREATVGDESLAADLLARIRQSGEQLERRVDEGVRAAVARATPPVSAEIAALNDRLDRLSKRIDDEARRRAERRQAAPGTSEAGHTEGAP